MNKKKNCCDFFKKILKKEPKDQPESSQNHVGSTVKTSFEENSEVQGKSKSSNEEKKSQKMIISENSIPRNESDSNSFFYDKNSAIIEVTDKSKALENLKEAYGIISKSQENQDNRPISVKDQFTKVIKGINFKEILAGEDSIIISGRSDVSNISIAND